MSVIIQNISKKYSHTGKQDYVVRVNDLEICRLKHDAENGLAVLLFNAGCEVEKVEIKRLRELTEHIKRLESMPKNTKKGMKNDCQRKDLYGNRKRNRCAC
jgi:hypothetical protein